MLLYIEQFNNDMKIGLNFIDMKNRLNGFIPCKFNKYT